MANEGRALPSLCFLCLFLRVSKVLGLLVPKLELRSLGDLARSASSAFFSVKVLLLQA